MIVPVDIMVFVYLVIPPVLGYFVLAVLSVIPQTHSLRVALWPIIALLATRAVLYVDVSVGNANHKSINKSVAILMFLIVTRTFEWILKKEPLIRHLYPANGSRSTIVDAFDLTTTLRGHGWEWSRRVPIPPETRPTDRRGFIFHVVLSTILHALISGFLETIIRSFDPTGFGAPSGGSIFDGTLPFYVCYSRSSIIALLAFIMTHAVIQTCYDVCTLVGILVFQQDPALWPPAFDSPWLATSLREFWGCRWHQFFRRIFLMHGGYPLSYFIGWPGVFWGAFLASGFYHHLGMTIFDGESVRPWGMLFGFGMMGTLVLAEWAFHQVTGKKVGGTVGWIWTHTCLTAFGNLLYDTVARTGGIGYFAFVERIVPGRDVIRSVVAYLDAWLHTI